MAKKLKRQIGKNTLGGGKKMTVDLRTYNRSTHDLSYAWRSTMNVGTLVPFMCEIALPGDTWDLSLKQKIITIPTTGPLFGSYKAQFDIFTCPIRLYQAMLHNNKLNVGLNMAQVKLPQFEVFVPEDTLPTAYNQWSQVHPSALLAYLGRRGFAGKASEFPNKNLVHFCAVPAIAYYDIFKNYYANKQEEKFYTIGGITTYEYYDFFNITQSGILTGGELIVSNKMNTDNLRLVFENIKYEGNKINEIFIVSTRANNLVITKGNNNIATGKLKRVEAINANAVLKEWNLTDIDDVREDILSKGNGQYKITNANKNYLGYLIDTMSGSIDKNNVYNSANPQAGLCLKTLQSDIFNNWINTEWIDGENGIANITAVDVSDGKLRLDQLNLQQKVYNMLNRIALSGGSYQDWIQTVYTASFSTLAETPLYEGGMSCEVIFQEVVSTAQTTDQPLGTLAGRGTSTNGKNGKLHINVQEPSILIGIVSLTPRVDYCQGNSWHTELETMDDLHKPELDGIGFQDLTANKIAWWKEKTTAIGKQPAWIDYMTNFNKTFGNFAIQNNQSFMVLNRYYYPENNDYKNGNLNYTTYINPEDYNYIFAETGIGAQNFWVQIGVGAKVRRKMSAKMIPNL